jgi:citrate lyase subunit beta/citryl-CoA lyase
MNHIRSYLYVPGDRPDRLAKAMSRGADALIVDLEDAVPSASKADARRNVADWLAGLGSTRTPVWIRVNAGPERNDDIRAIADAPHVTGLVLAKADSPGDVEEVADQLSGIGSPLRLAPLIESAAGVLAVREIAAAPRVELLHLGELDLAADIGASPGADGAELHHSRSMVVLASRAAQISPPVAPVDAVIDDLAHFRATTEALARMGFVGRACIHPAQVAVAQEVFTPSADDIAWARELLESEKSSTHGARRGRDGRMVDEAVLRRARALSQWS